MKRVYGMVLMACVLVAPPARAAWVGTDAGSDDDANRYDDDYYYLHPGNWDGGVIDGSFAGTDFVNDGSGGTGNVFLWLDDHTTDYPLDLSHGGAGSLWLVGRGDPATLRLGSDVYNTAVNGATSVATIGQNGHPLALDMNGGTRTFFVERQLDIRSGLQGTGTLVKEGAGTMLVFADGANPNTFAGDVIVNGGRFQAAGPLLNVTNLVITGGGGAGGIQVEGGSFPSVTHISIAGGRLWIGTANSFPNVTHIDIGAGGLLWVNQTDIFPNVESIVMTGGRLEVSNADAIPNLYDVLSNDGGVVSLSNVPGAAGLLEEEHITIEGVTLSTRTGESYPNVKSITVKEGGNITAASANAFPNVAFVRLMAESAMGAYLDGVADAFPAATDFYLYY
ncbi:MAG: hypothetical protein FWF84_04240, partial [Kiritimatiellaeota bacterium]|nr:hypothetical protein [Kiritimatiellota bacterium]